jgi:hypothetical protein
MVIYFTLTSMNKTPDRKKKEWQVNHFHFNDQHDHVELFEVRRHVWEKHYLKIINIHTIWIPIFLIPAVCDGLIPIPSLVMIALVAAWTLN